MEDASFFEAVVQGLFVELSAFFFGLVT